jgi:sigma-B regulation protein RsbU (phosphoserine phosphatase)
MLPEHSHPTARQDDGEGREGVPPFPTRLRVTGLAAAVLGTVVVAAQLIELFINRVLRPDLEEWTWISEVLVLAALLVLTALWAQLRLARTAIADLERERLTIHAELAVAAKVQRALLPLIPEPAHGITWYAIMEPAGEVGGDYYDFFSMGNDRMCVVLADVSGKGVPAAVFVSNTRAVLRAVAREGRSTPGRVLTAVSEILLRDGRSDLYVTCVVAIVDTQQHTMVYANAGHPPGVVLSTGGGTHALGVGGPPLGLLAAADYDEERVTLAPGDLVVLVSDGITDAIDASGDDIPMALRAELAKLRERTPELACRALLATARRSPGPRGVAKWADDRTVVAFAWSPGPSDS